MTATEEMDVLCSDKTGTLTLNKLTVDKNLIEVFAKGIDKDTVVLMVARASRTKNRDSIDAAIVGILADPKEARVDIQEVHFLPFNPIDKRTTLTYIDGQGTMHRVSKGAPEQILNLTHNKSKIERRVHTIIDKFVERGLRSLAIAYQVLYCLEKFGHAVALNGFCLGIGIRQVNLKGGGHSWLWRRGHLQVQICPSCCSD